MLLEGQMLEYVENTPKGIFRTYEIGLTQVNFWNFGGEFIGSEWELETSFIFDNKWELHADVERDGRTLDASLLRGGPGVYMFGETSQDYFLRTDGSKKITAGMGYENDLSDDGISNRHEWHSEISWKVTNSLLLTPEFSFNKSIFDYQYISDYESEGQQQYLLGRLDRKTYELTLRLSYSITPVFTIQYYGSPYITMGKYSHFKSLADHDARNPEKVFHTFSNSELSYDPDQRTYYQGDISDPDLSFSNPDFNFRQFRSNLVARLEYRRGSVIYLVWTHNRTSSESITNNSFDYNIDRLFNEHAENVFLIKFNYWFSL
jgi:hypothetical protein